MNAEISIEKPERSLTHRPVADGFDYVAVNCCPACGSDEYPLEGTAIAGFSEFVGEREFKQPSYAIRDCINCGLLYRSCTFSDAGFVEFYRRMDFRGWEIDGLYPTERAVLAVLRELPPGQRILDFGCGSGRLLSKLISTHQCYGVEVNVGASAEATAKGSTMLPLDLSVNGTASQFDVVLLIDVFEHLTEPLVLLRRLVRRLRVGGMLIIVTGNGDAPLCRLDPGQFWYFRTVQHVCMLTRRHAEFLSRELGVRIEGWQELSHYDTPWPEKLWQWGRHFAYWQFRNHTLLARTMLGFVPFMRRARLWKVAPALTYSLDHVMAVLRKDTRSENGTPQAGASRRD